MAGVSGALCDYPLSAYYRLRAGFRSFQVFSKIAKSRQWPGVYFFRNFEKLMLALWTIRCYLAPTGRDMIDDWYRRQSDEVQGALDVALEYLVQRPRDEWRRPEFDLLSGKMRAVGEIRLKVDKQYRILGFFGPGRSDFTLLVGASKKGKVYSPTGALETALKRMAEVKADGRRSRVCAL
jgi:hypothetical protein